MSRNLSAAACRVHALSASTLLPDGFRRGRSQAKNELDNDEAGEPIVANIFADFEGEEHIPDYEALARDLGVNQIRVGDKTVVRTCRPLKADKPLLVVYSNNPTKTILTVDFGLSLQSLEDLGFDHLSIVLAACRSAKELNLNPREMGAKRLFREAAELQSRATEQREAFRRAEVARKAAQLAKPTHTGGIKPRLALPGRSTLNPAPTLRLAPVAPRPEPGASARALRERIEAGKQAATRLHSSIGALVLLNRALAARNEVQAQRLVEDAERMLRACEKAGPLPEPRPARPAQAPRASRPVAPPPACFGNGSPNTAARKAAQLAKKRATTAKYGCPKGSSNGGGSQHGKGGGKKKNKK